MVVQDFWPGGTSPVITPLPFKTEYIDAGVACTIGGPYELSGDNVTEGFIVPVLH